MSCPRCGYCPHCGRGFYEQPHFYKEPPRIEWSLPEHAKEKLQQYVDLLNRVNGKAPAVSDFAGKPTAR